MRIPLYPGMPWSENENGDRLLFYHIVELHVHSYKNKIPLSFEKQGCAKSSHTFLSIVELKGDYTIVLNIRLKLKWKIYLNRASVKGKIRHKISRLRLKMTRRGWSK
jgi:hypothetical protein